MCCFCCPKFFKKLRYGCFKYYKTCYWPGCEFRGCCGFPHGMCYTLMGQMSALGGMTMCMYVVMSCFFEQITQINPNTGEPIENSERGYGFISREADFGLTPDYRQCIYYPSDEVDIVIDGWFKSGRVFAFLASLLGFTCLVVLVFACCFAFTPVTFERWLMWFYILAAISMAMTFMIFGSNFCKENECKLGQGGGYGISGFLFFLVAANSVKSMSPALPKDFGSPENDRQGRDLWYDNEDDMYRRRDNSQRYQDDDENLYRDDDSDYEYVSEEEYESGEEYEEGYDSDEYETDSDDEDNVKDKNKKPQQQQQAPVEDNIELPPMNNSNNNTEYNDTEYDNNSNNNNDFDKHNVHNMHDQYQERPGNLGAGYENEPRVGKKDGPVIT